MSTRTIVILVLLGLVLAYFLAPAPAPAAPDPKPSTPEGDLANAVTDLLKGPVTTFLAPGGGVVSSAPSNATSVPAIPSSSPYVGTLMTSTAPTPAAQSAANEVAAFANQPATDLRIGILRGWGRKWIGSIFYTYSASSLTQQRLQNLTPGAGGGLWSYTGPALQPQPSVSEWNAFDAARRSLLGR